MLKTGKAPRLFVIGAGIATMTSVAAWLLAPIEARFISSLTDNPMLVGVTYAIGTTAFSILALVLGRVSDRLGRERMILTGLVVGVIYPLFYASAINIFTYMGVELLWAAAAVGTGPVLMAHLQELVHDRADRAHLMSLMYGAMSLSGAVGHLAGGYVASVFGLTGPYYLLAGIYFCILVVAVPVLLGKRDPAEKPTDTAEVDEQHGLNKDSFLFGVRYVFHKPILVYYFILNGAFAIGYRVKLILWPLIVVLFIESPVVMGIIFAGTGVAAFLVLLFSGKVVDKYGAYVGAHAAYLALILGGFLMAYTGSYVWFGIGAAVFAIGEAFWGSAQALLLIDNVASKHRGEILGIDHIFDNSYSTVAMLAAGALMVMWSPQTVWLLFMWIMVVSYVVAQVYKYLRVDVRASGSSVV